jgi:hypothetical protein
LQGKYRRTSVTQIERTSMFEDNEEQQMNTIDNNQQVQPSITTSILPAFDQQITRTNDLFSSITSPFDVSHEQSHSISILTPIKPVVRTSIDNKDGTQKITSSTSRHEQALGPSTHQYKQPLLPIVSHAAFIDQ